ncbi:MAG TPA: glycosyltransferase [Acidobacteriaceae bacterium]|nr:glycosyltransferase [Acidobacteriaceae bacterium]
MLAVASQRQGYEVVFACDERNRWVLADESIAHEHLSSIPTERFLRAVSRAAPVYDYATLTRYVRDDLALIERVSPDLIVGDLRLSLSVSARLAAVPYAAIANAYWSPYIARKRYPIPPLAGIRFVPLAPAEALFNMVRPAAFAWHAVPLNRVRRKHGLPPIKFDVRNVYTDGDHVLYADVPELFPLVGAPPTNHFLGPIIWSPPAPLPEWWKAVTHERPIIYVTMGSSGDPALLQMIFKALAGLPVLVLAATVGAECPRPLPANVLVAKYLPGDAVAAMAALVICNGGAPTSQQALANGVPVLGIATNMDQILNMQAITEVGAGILLRGQRTTARAVRQAIVEILNNHEHSTAAQAMASTFKRYRAVERFGDFASALLR